MLFTLATFIVALTVFAAAAPQPARGGVAIPITKRSTLVNANKTVDLHAVVAHVESVKAKICRGFENFEKNTGRKHPSATSNGVEKRGAGVGMFDSNNNELWYGAILVGTPPESFTVQFDTGSCDLLLPTIACPTCGGHSLWRPILSSTAKDLHRTFNLTFGDGSAFVTGELCTDTVSIAGYTATRQTIGAALNYSSQFYIPNFAPDGLMGMAFQSISGFHPQTPGLFQTLVSEKHVDKPAFSFKLASSGSELYIGGANSDLYSGDFTYVPVTEEGYWQVKMDNIQANGRTYAANIDVLIDTGTTYIIGDLNQVARLYEDLGGTQVAKGSYTLPCKSFPSISLSFGGTSFPILASALNRGMVSDGTCLSTIVGADLSGFGSHWIIGDTFLQSVYTTFDVGKSRVGFARLA